MSPAYPEFKGKRALITGGTQGIGKAVAKRLALEGAVVYLNYARNEQAARETLNESRDAGYASELCRADMGAPDAVEAMLGQIHHGGPLDLLVCNAAYQEKGKGFFDADLALIQRTLDINILANFQIIQKVAREMIAAKRQGRMVMCSSGHGTMVFKGTFAYDVSKAALNPLWVPLRPPEAPIRPRCRVRVSPENRRSQDNRYSRSHKRTHFG
jgi:3-oxoacyl-[acyl-carrier protein] reductase